MSGPAGTLTKFAGRVPQLAGPMTGVTKPESESDLALAVWYAVPPAKPGRTSAMTRFSCPFLLILLVGLTACGGGGATGKASPKAARPPEPDVWMELRRGTAPQELVHIGVQGVMIGTAGEPLTVRLFAGPGRSDSAWYFLRSFAPFELKSPQGNLVVHSMGRVSAGPVEERMIFEWARSVAAEAADPRVTEAYGLVLAWHQGGSSGICRDVALYLTGKAVASACGWDKNVEGRLNPTTLGQVYGWFDRLKPFQTGAGEQDMRQGSLETRLVFAGHGNHPAGADEQAEMQTFGAALYGELAARREAAVPPPSSLLLPAHLVPPNETEIVLQVPDKPPPPPAGEGVTPAPRPARPRPAETPEESPPGSAPVTSPARRGSRG
jgi:hypothetical protein